MSNQFSYYTTENMQDKKMSDLRSDRNFLRDGVTFLKSGRKGYTDEEISEMSADDVVSEVLEHFRYQTVNEVTMAKDMYYMKDNTVGADEKQSFGRLMFAFDNAKGEGLFDRGGEKIGDYFGGIGFAPTTYASVLAGLGSAGTGAAAIQSTKAASVAALRQLGKNAIKRSLVAGVADGAIGAGQEYGNQKIREAAAPDLGIDYKIDKGAVALSGALGFGIGSIGYGVPALLQHMGAKKLADTIEQGRVANADRVAEAAAIASLKVKEAAKDATKNAKMEGATKKVLQAIDPNLVREGDLVKRYLLSEDLPEGVVGGLSKETIQRLSAASYDLAERIGVDLSDETVRITEVLANNIGRNKEIFIDVAKEYGLTPRQLSATYAAEVSQAAKILAGQSAISKKARRNSLEELSKKIDDLYAEGMAPAKAEDLAAIASSTRDTQSVIWRKFKDIENARRMFMTSQPATTMRNNIFSVAMTVIDGVDQLNQAVLDRVTKGRKLSINTVQETIANARYLTTDNYVADALVTMLQKDTPEKFQRVFFDAALAEAHIVKDSKLAKMGAAVNTLNTMSDYVVKRAVIAGTIDRRLRVLGNEKLGTSVMDMLRKGTVNELPEDILNEALDESLAFTFQRRFGGKDASGMNRAAAEIIRGIHNFGFTIIIPFPRYLASQAKFVSDYTGLTVIRRGITKATTQEYSKFMTGAMMFGGLYSVQKENIAKGLEWFEIQGEDGKTYDGQAAFGPLSAEVYLANLAARMTEGQPIKSAAEIANDLRKILGGTEFRPGVGFVENSLRGFEAGSFEPFLNSIGDYAGSFTYPAAVLKDFYSQFDPRSSYLPETRDASISEQAPEGSHLYNMLDYITPFDIPISSFQRVTRHLPDFDSDKISKQLEESLGISIAPDTIAKFLEFANSSTRTYYQTQYTKDADGNNMRQDAIRFDIFGDGPIKIQDPIVKQITGFVGRPPKNALQREMSRLQLDPFKIYNPYREKNQALELFTQQKLQGNLSAKVEMLMQTEAYQNLTDAEKKVYLVGKDGVINSTIREYREDAKADLQKMASMPEAQQDYRSYIRGEFKAVTGKARDQADVFWKRTEEKHKFKNMNVNEALKLIDESQDLDEREKEDIKTNIRKYYITLSK